MTAVASSQEVWTQKKLVSALLPVDASGEVMPNRCTASHEVMFRAGQISPKPGNETPGKRNSPPTICVAQAYRHAVDDNGSLESPTSILDELRARDYARLDTSGYTYLDYTGGSLYATSQLDRHMALLRDSVFGNPHSTNPSASAATDLIAMMRRAVLRFFNASPEEWEAIFTANASQALKLVGESYPFGPGDRYLMTFDNHNSVNGIREFARAKGATSAYVPVVLPEMFVDERDLARELEQGRAATTSSPIRRSPTSPGCSIRWRSSGSLNAPAGT